MKKFLFLICFVCSLFTFAFFENCYALTLTTYTYAKITRPGVYLYKMPDASCEDNILFEIPESYFVMLLVNFDDLFYKAQYKDCVGYVLKESVSPVAEKPINPYANNLTFRVFSSDGKDVVISPTSSKNSTVVTTVELFENIEYYGEILGDELIVGRGRVWYYGKTSDNKFGYLYSGLCDGLGVIPQNNELVTLIGNPFGDDDDGYLYNLVNLTSGLKVFLIILVTLPSGIIVWLLFKPYKEPISLKSRKRKHIRASIVKQIEDYTDDTI